MRVIQVHLSVLDPCVLNRAMWIFEAFLRSNSGIILHRLHVFYWSNALNKRLWDLCGLSNRASMEMKKPITEIPKYWTNWGKRNLFHPPYSIWMPHRACYDVSGCCVFQDVFTTPLEAENALGRRFLWGKYARFIIINKMRNDLSHSIFLWMNSEIYLLVLRVI